jgi:hypothetical protein
MDKKNPLTGRLPEVNVRKQIPVLENIDLKSGVT